MHAPRYPYRLLLAFIVAALLLVALLDVGVAFALAALPLPFAVAAWYVNDQYVRGVDSCLADYQSTQRSR